MQLEVIASEITRTDDKLIEKTARHPVDASPFPAVSIQLELKFQRELYDAR